MGNKMGPSYANLEAVCGLSHHNTESRKNMEQKFIFQIDTRSPSGSN